MAKLGYDQGTDMPMAERGRPPRATKKLLAAAISSVILISAIVWVALARKPGDETMPTNESMITISLPEPRRAGTISVEEALLQRRSIRRYSNEPLNPLEVSQLLWAAQGTTNPRGFRTAPSAGALYPLEMYVVIGNVTGMENGVYRYRPEHHDLTLVTIGDKRAALGSAALGQLWIRKAAIDIVFSAVYERTTKKYGLRGAQYVHMEVGHAAQNVYLQAVSLNLGTCAVGAFDDGEVMKVVHMPDSEQPLYIMPVGKKE